MKAELLANLFPFTVPRKVRQTVLVCKNAFCSRKCLIEINCCVRIENGAKKRNSLNMIPVEVRHKDIVVIVWRRRSVYCKFAKSRTTIQYESCTIVCRKFNTGRISANSAKEPRRKGCKETGSAVFVLNVFWCYALNNCSNLSLNLLRSYGRRQGASDPPKMNVHYKIPTICLSRFSYA